MAEELHQIKFPSFTAPAPQLSSLRLWHSSAHRPHSVRTPNLYFSPLSLWRTTLLPKGGRMQQTAVACPVSARSPLALRTHSDLTPPLRSHLGCTFTLAHYLIFTLTHLLCTSPTISAVLAVLSRRPRRIPDATQTRLSVSAKLSLQRLATPGTLSVVCSALQGECPPAAHCALRCALYAMLRCARAPLSPLSRNSLRCVLCPASRSYTRRLFVSTVTTLRDYRRVSYSGFGSISIRRRR